jgi:tRNA1(Val) A37 N6-methylase TrmN6
VPDDAAAAIDGSNPRDTQDAFHRGRFIVVQPAQGAHRAGMDALVLAAAVPSDFSGRLADFGAGAGAVGLAVAARLPGATVRLVEKSPDMAGFAARTLAHPANAALAPRLSLLIADVALAGRERHAAGLPDRSFDFVAMNPPFNDARDRPAADKLKRLAHAATGDLFERWLRSAAALLVPSGHVALIARPESLTDVLAALTGRFGGAGIVPIHARADTPAIRIVVRAKRGSRARTALLPGLVLHEGADHRLTPLAQAIASGEASLFGD